MWTTLHSFLGRVAQVVGNLVPSIGKSDNLLPAPWVGEVSCAHLL